EPGNELLAATTSKIVLMPRFARLSFSTEAFRPGGADPRELGFRVLDAVVADECVLDRIAWERSSYGPERAGGQRFYWTRPSGEAAIPVPGGVLPATLSLTWAAERDKEVSVGGQALRVGPDVRTVQVDLADPLVDVMNNAGGVVFADGYGADRGYQEVDSGQYDEPTPVFTACGAAMALRTEAGRAAGWFDDDFFLYYEDTDLGWRLRGAGHDIRYEPKALVRHHHSATSREFSRLWQFHVERNRLLMLTKNATVPLAGRQVAGYCLTTASMAVRALRRRDRASACRVLVRVHVLVSYLRLLPRMLRRRRESWSGRGGQRGELQRSWLAQR
ncbi:MAG: glycosyltransferase family 2 protein, partial [Mycobacteriales bacterium]